MNDDNKGQGGLIERIQESPRTVSALIIILIVAAAIYAFSGDRSTPATSPEVTEGEEVVSEGEETPSEQSPIVSADSETPTPKSTAEPLPEARKTNTAYEEVAQAGNGVTHLARRAADRWLTENQAGYTVQKEHRIYIEDYIQKKVGKKGLSLGESQAISFDLIKEAVSKAENLSDAELKNLSKYTYVLT